MKNALTFLLCEYNLSLLRSIIPIGTVIVCPTADIPTYGRGVWLECNGQSFSTMQFPQLYESLRTNRVPDYRGMFLRGYGSQSYSQDNGQETSSNTTHFSGNIGQIQGDATRRMNGGYGGMQWTSNMTVEGLGTRVIHNSASIVDYGNTGMASFPRISGTSTIHGFNSNFPTANSSWYEALTKYRYTISCSIGEDGEDCTLNEEEIHPNFLYMSPFVDMEFDNAWQNPIANEIRPVNVAVKFMIKAK